MRYAARDTTPRYIASIETIPTSAFDLIAMSLRAMSPAMFTDTARDICRATCLRRYAADAAVVIAIVAVR